VLKAWSLAGAIFQEILESIESGAKLEEEIHWEYSFEGCILSRVTNKATNFETLS
jgi:hypothetical protein